MTTMAKSETNQNTRPGTAKQRVEPHQPGQTRLLAVEDEQDLAEVLQHSLARDGFAVRCIARGDEALKLIRQDPPEIILLDLMLPGMDGLELCRIIRDDPRTATIPIVMLTAKGEEPDVVIGLELGADDYLTKPFSPRVLIARLKAVLRRRDAKAQPDDDTVLYLGNLVIDPARHEVRVDGTPVTLTQTEFTIIRMLAQRPGRVFTRQQIVHRAQGQFAAVTDRSVDVHIVSLRRKLGQAGGRIQTVRGVGYRMEDL